MAGHQYRLQQARNIIRSVVIKRGDVDVRPVYVYVDNDRKYQPATVVVDEPEMYALLWPRYFAKPARHGRP